MEMHVRGTCAVVLLTTLASSCASSSSGTPVVPLSVQVSPVPVKTGDGTMIEYELYVGRYVALGLQPTRVDVLRDSADGAIVKTYAGADLARFLVPPPEGYPDVAMVLVGLTLPEGQSIPATLHHALTFADGTSVRGGVANVATVAPVILSAPVKGASWVMGQGPTLEPVYHRNAHFHMGAVDYFSERFAIDFVKLGPDGTLAAGDGSRNEDWYCYGQDLLAVADGTIVDARDGVPDNQGGVRVIPMTMENLGGNYVVLDIRDRHDHFAFYAHAIPGSITVKIGDRVTAGQLLGKLGNSGNSGAPHLHFHVCDGSGPMGTRDESIFCNGLPYAASSFVLLGKVGPDFWQAITTWTPSGPPQVRTEEGFLRDQVVNLGP
jgi:hypothetical protein